MSHNLIQLVKSKVIASKILRKALKTEAWILEQ